MAMKVAVRFHKSGAWEYDIQVRLPDGRQHRERRRSRLNKTATREYAERRAADLMMNGLPEQVSEVPTFAEFAPQYLAKARADRLKASTMTTYRQHVDEHLVPLLGNRRLDAISKRDEVRLKTALAGLKPATVDNVLQTLRRVLRVGVELGVIDRVPLQIEMVRTSRQRKSGRRAFLDFEAYLKIVAAAKRVGWQAHLIVLMGGDAGMRGGEIRGLEWVDVDLDRRQIEVRQAEVRGEITTPKSGTARTVGMTKALWEALTRYRHLRGDRVVCEDDGRPVTKRVVERCWERVLRAAQVRKMGGLHVLRHTFCSHLAMRGVPARTIQALAGHANLQETERYMHLSPAAIEDGIRALDRRPTGEIVESGLADSAT
jgi:integrase